MKEFIMRLQWVDYVAALVLLRGFYVGYKGGVFPEILRIASYLITFLITFWFYQPIAQQLILKTFLNSTTSTAVAFVLLLAAGLIATKLVCMVLLKILKVGEGGVPIRLVGMVIGGLRWIVLLSFIFMMIDHSPLEQLKKDIHTRSVVGEPVSQVAPLIFDYLSQLSPQLDLSRNTTKTA